MEAYMDGHMDKQMKGKVNRGMGHVDCLKRKLAKGKER